MTRSETKHCGMNCGATFELHQTCQEGSGEWHPTLGHALRVNGWVEKFDVLFCGAFCASKFAFANSGRPGDVGQPIAVTKRIIPSPQRPTEPSKSSAKKK